MSKSTVRPIFLAAFSIVTLFACLHCARAQTVNITANLIWKAVTAYTDGSAISGAVTYNVYSGKCVAGPFTKVASGLATLTSVQPFTAGTCFEITAQVGGIESAPTPPVTVIQPGTPGGVGVTVTVTIH